MQNDCQRRRVCELQKISEWLHDAMKFSVAKTFGRFVFITGTQSELGGCHVMRRRKADAEFVQIKICSTRFFLPCHLLLCNKGCTAIITCKKTESEPIFMLIFAGERGQTLVGAVVALVAIYQVSFQSDTSGSIPD